MSKLSEGFIKQFRCLIKKYLTRETIMYLIFGVLTSVLSIVIFNTANKFGFHVAASNTVSTIIAVIFAFITNKLFVFESKSLLPSIIFPELIKFASGRAIMFFIETALLVVLISYLGLYEPLAKIFTTMIVIIGNYFISKKAVFKENKP